MPKKKIGVLPIDLSVTEVTFDYAKIVEIRNDCVIVEHLSEAKQLIPLYRFINEKDIMNLYIGAKVKINYYNSMYGKKELLAYNVELSGE